MLTTWAFPIVQFVEISDDAIVRTDRLDITETPRWGGTGREISEDDPESKNEMLPNSGVAMWGGVSRTREGLDWMVGESFAGEGDLEPSRSNFKDKGPPVGDTGDSCGDVAVELIEFDVERKEVRLISAICANRI